VPSIRLIVHLYHVLACSRNNTTRIEHHASNGVVVGVGVVDRSGTEIPDLSLLAREKCGDIGGGDLPEYSCLRLQ
jgi:hypothetical protein